VGKIKFHLFWNPWKNLFGYPWKIRYSPMEKIFPTPMFKALCISCRYSSLSAVFPALTRLASVMVFSSPKCTSCVSNGVEVTRFKRPLKYFFLRFLRTSSSLLSRTSFLWLMDLSILYLFCHGIAGRCARILYWFASNWNQSLCRKFSQD